MLKWLHNILIRWLNERNAALLAVWTMLNIKCIRASVQFNWSMIVLVGHFLFDTEVFSHLNNSFQELAYDLYTQNDEWWKVFRIIGLNVEIL